MDDALRREGWAREVVRAIQNARKDAGLDVSDRIALTLGGDAELVAVAEEFERLVADEVLATSVAFGGDGGYSATVDGRPLVVGVRRAG
jgi:isoleucyl-tRNA synthetase